LAPNTVARAYRELEAEGYLITRGRHDRRPDRGRRRRDQAACGGSGRGLRDGNARPRARSRCDPGRGAPRALSRTPIFSLAGNTIE
jgi:DNA-binding transcriptional MocR family regulator